MRQSLPEQSIPPCAERLSKECPGDAIEISPTRQTNIRESPVSALSQFDQVAGPHSVKPVAFCAEHADPPEHHRPFGPVVPEMIRHAEKTKSLGG